MSQTQTYYGQQSCTRVPPAAPSPILQNIYGDTFANVNPHRSSRRSSGIFSLHASDLNINFSNNDNPPETPSRTRRMMAPATLPVQEEEEDNREDDPPQPPSRGSGGNPRDNSPEHPEPSGGDADPEDNPSGPPGGGPPGSGSPGSGPPPGPPGSPRGPAGGRREEPPDYSREFMTTFNRFTDVLERIGSGDSKSKVKEPEPFDGNDPRKL
ncbi:hypothetical protein VKT23_000949 [Stygiomarasmius scandens]|uniref:Uncharacterized protein n=1 Tax=Marasmiellus scandens TaxID=2682957 RepID=A0ABR1K6M0_9AGAR